jgi:hypothetical protein
MAEVNARFQQFFNSNTDHLFPLVESPPSLWIDLILANHPAEHGIVSGVVVVTRTHPGPGFRDRSTRFSGRRRNSRPAEKGPPNYQTVAGRQSFNSRIWPLV